jgi:hypothetical protein
MTDNTFDAAWILVFFLAAAFSLAALVHRNCKSQKTTKELEQLYRRSCSLWAFLTSDV